MHAGQHPDPLTGAVNVPVYLSSTFELTGIGTDRGWDYSRAGNPTRDRLETALAALEGGQAATHLPAAWRPSPDWWRCCTAGDHMLCTRMSTAERCGSSTRLSSHYGIEVEYVDTDKLDAVAAAITAQYEIDSCGDAHQSADGAERHCCDQQAGARQRCGSERGQYLHVAGAAKPAGTGRGHCDAFHDQIPEWPFRWNWRGADRLNARAQGAFRVCAEGGRGGSCRHSNATSCCAVSGRCPCA